MVKTNIKKRILIVDDEEANRKLFTLFCEDLGCEVVTAEDGKDAVAKTLKHLPDLIVMDISMPVMDGLTATELIKKNPATRIIPIIIVTGLGCKENMMKGLSNGASDFMSKPVNMEEFALRVRNQLKAKEDYDYKAIRLDETKSILREYIDSSSDGVVIISKELVVLEINNGGLKILETTGDKAAGKQISKIIPEQDKGGRINILKKVVETGKVFKIPVLAYKVPGGNNIKILDIVAFKVKKGLGLSIRDVTESYNAEVMLKKQKLELENKNIALREVLSQIENEKKEAMDNIREVLNKAVKPIIARVKSNKCCRENAKQVELLEKVIDNISEKTGNSVHMDNRLSPREFEIAGMIKNGLASKDIAEMLSISVETVKTVRRNIRKKLGVTKKDINLYTLMQEK